MDDKRFKICKRFEEQKGDIFPQEDVITYLKLKAEGKSKSQIIKVLGLRCTYMEQRLRLYILQRMGCKTLNQAVIKACKLGWIDYTFE